ncbi:MAG TPA: alpha/beta hydrolase [Tepidisphaeraceae bacterium]|jgi:hypothetical protein
MVYLSLIAMLLLAAALCAAGVVVLTAFHLIKPPRMEDGKALHVLKRLTPEDLALAYEITSFTVNDRGQALKIAAWWMPAGNSPKSVILLHGFADAKVGAIAWAPTWHHLGWNVLAIDLRAHGESGGRFCTAGYFERNDLRQIIDQLRSARPAASSDIALFGVSLGAAVATAAAEGRSDLSAVVLDSPYATYRAAAKAHADRLAVPLTFTRTWAVWLAERITGALYGQIDPIDLLPKLSCPALVFHGNADTSISAEVLAQFAAIDRPRYRHVVVPGATHNMAMHVDPQQYADTIAAFLRQSPAPAAGAGVVTSDAVTKKHD